jgi:hypothetical protein
MEIKIQSATFEWMAFQTPGILLEMELVTDSGPVKVTATICEVQPIMFANNLIYLEGKSQLDREALVKYLPPREIPEHPGEFMNSVTDDPKILALVRYFLDAINYRNGARFVEHASLPPSLF